MALSERGGGGDGTPLLNLGTGVFIGLPSGCQWLA